MPKLRRMLPPALLTAAGVGMVMALLSACSPSYNWRDFHSPDGAYSVLFPEKPAALTRIVQLDGGTLNMTMHGAEIDGVSFTVGNAQMKDATQAEAALRAMRNALVRNIAGSVLMEKVSAQASTVDGSGHRSTSIEIRVKGKQNGTALLMAGRFITRDARVFQVIVLGPEKAVSADHIDIFLGSFKGR